MFIKRKLSDLVNIELSPEQNYTESSFKESITPSMKYSVTTEVIGRRGTPYSAYFYVILKCKKIFFQFCNYKAMIV